tara:strand:- start:551 stop:1144 length:594 start_codon:yes stop_codon:yes gene_type:complete
MDRDDHTLLKKVQTSWSTYKTETSTSQAKAAKALGMNQSAFSQYLRGDIPTNTDFLQKFSKLTGEDLIGSAVKIQNLKSRTLTLRYALSNAEPLLRNVLVSSAIAVDDCYGVLIDIEHFYSRDSVLIVDPNAEIRELDIAVLIDNGQVRLGTMQKLDDSWIIRIQSWGTSLDHRISSGDTIHRVTSVYFPERTGSTL